MSKKGSDFYIEFEVFSRKAPSSPMEHKFSLLAPNHEIALVMAQENFMRREEVADIWVCKRSDVRKMNQEERQTLQRLDNKDYRTTKGYGYLKKKWRNFEQKILDEEEILSWGGDQKND